MTKKFNQLTLKLIAVDTKQCLIKFEYVHVFPIAKCEFIVVLWPKYQKY